ncbi:DNA-directed RNA polymerase specialized sigma24 family protein [Streptomyces calvus]
MTHLSATAYELVLSLRPLLGAEAAAEAPGCGAEPGDLEQAVWLRLLERLHADGPPADPPDWLRRAVRAEARRLGRTARREIASAGEPGEPVDGGPARPRTPRARRRPPPRPAGRRAAPARPLPPADDRAAVPA